MYRSQQRLQNRNPIKRITAAGLVLRLFCGCTASVSESDESYVPPEQDMEENFEFIKDAQYGRLSLRWNVPGTDCISEIAVVKADGEVLYTYQTYDTYADAGNLLGYACQENNWYKDAAFTVTVRDRSTENILAEYHTEAFPVTEWFPEAETIDVADRSLKTFSWNRQTQTSYIEKLNDVLHNFSLYIYDDKPAKFNAVYYNSAGKQIDITREMNEADLNTLLGYIRGGQLERKSIPDPELVLLDAPTPERMDAVFDGADILEKNWYSYIMPTNAKQELLEAVRSFCRDGRWPS